jgi:hypothetical protein
VLAQTNFGRKSRKFEEIKATLENGERAGNRGNPTLRKSSYKVDKLLRSSWKVGTCQLGE